MEEMSVQEIDEFVKTQRLGRLGCHDDGRTYVVPLMFARAAECFYFYTIEGQKVHMMRRNPSVCFELDELVANGSWTSVIVQGTFEELTGEDALLALRVLGHESPASQGENGSSRRGEGNAPVAFLIRVSKVTGRKVVRS
jgi:nitroimidazol reductase NimA-like FMN-containing flavoprotein (pyridoxamine 5'-phosphate oxidase superfamily)